MGRRAARRHGPTPGQAEEGLTLDAGALIALERTSSKVTALLDRAVSVGWPIAVPAAALAQAWRASPRQHRLALLLTDDGVEVSPVGLQEALAIGALLADTRTSDVVDASVVLTARKRRHRVVTSDPADLRRLDPSLVTIAI